MSGQMAENLDMSEAGANAQQNIYTKKQNQEADMSSRNSDVYEQKERPELDEEEDEGQSEEYKASEQQLKQVSGNAVNMANMMQQAQVSPQDLIQQLLLLQQNNQLASTVQTISADVNAHAAGSSQQQMLVQQQAALIMQQNQVNQQLAAIQMAMYLQQNGHSNAAADVLSNQQSLKNQPSLGAASAALMLGHQGSFNGTGTSNLTFGNFLPINMDQVQRTRALTVPPTMSQASLTPQPTTPPVDQTAQKRKTHKADGKPSLNVQAFSKKKPLLIRTSSGQPPRRRGFVSESLLQQTVSSQRKLGGKLSVRAQIKNQLKQLNELQVRVAEQQRRVAQSLGSDTLEAPNKSTNYGAQGGQGGTRSRGNSPSGQDMVNRFKRDAKKNARDLERRIQELEMAERRLLEITRQAQPVPEEAKEDSGDQLKDDKSIEELNKEQDVPAIEVELDESSPLVMNADIEVTNDVEMFCPEDSNQEYKRVEVATDGTEATYKKIVHSDSHEKQPIESLAAQQMPEVPIEVKQEKVIKIALCEPSYETLLYNSEVYLLEKHPYNEGGRCAVIRHSKEAEEQQITAVPLPAFDYVHLEAVGGEHERDLEAEQLAIEQAILEEQQAEDRKRQAEEQALIEEIENQARAEKESKRLEEEAILQEQQKSTFTVQSMLADVFAQASEQVATLETMQEQIRAKLTKKMFGMFVKNQVDYNSLDLAEDSGNARFGFSITNLSVMETAGSVAIEILSKTGKQGEVRVVTVDNTANAYADFQPIDQTLKFEAGQKSQVVHLEIIDDDAWEPDETLFLDLRCPTSNKRLPGNDTRMTVKILDDDAPPEQEGVVDANGMNIQFGFEQLELQVAEDADKVDVVVLNKQEKRGKVRVKTEDGEARALDVYMPFDQIIKFKKGQRSSTVSIALKDDRKPSEQFYVTLRDPLNGERLLGKDSLQKITIADLKVEQTLSNIKEAEVVLMPDQSAEEKLESQDPVAIVEQHSFIKEAKEIQNDRITVVQMSDRDEDGQRPESSMQVNEKEEQIATTDRPLLSAEDEGISDDLAYSIKHKESLPLHATAKTLALTMSASSPTRIKQKDVPRTHQKSAYSGHIIAEDEEVPSRLRVTPPPRLPIEQINEQETEIDFLKPAQSGARKSSLKPPIAKESHRSIVPTLDLQPVKSSAQSEMPVLPNHVIMNAQSDPTLALCRRLIKEERLYVPTSADDNMPWIEAASRRYGQPSDWRCGKKRISGDASPATPPQAKRQSVVRARLNQRMAGEQKAMIRKSKELLNGRSSVSYANKQAFMRQSTAKFPPERGSVPRTSNHTNRFRAKLMATIKSASVADREESSTSSLHSESISGTSSHSSSYADVHPRGRSTTLTAKERAKLNAEFRRKSVVALVQNKNFEKNQDASNHQPFRRLQTRRQSKMQKKSSTQLTYDKMGVAEAGRPVRRYEEYTRKETEASKRLSKNLTPPRRGGCGNEKMKLAVLRQKTQLEEHNRKVMERMATMPKCDGTAHDVAKKRINPTAQYSNTIVMAFFDQRKDHVHIAGPLGDQIVESKVRQSERENRLKLVKSLKSFVKIATGKAKVSCMPGDKEHDRLMMRDIMLTERARIERERDGDEAQKKLIQEVSDPLIVTNLMIMHPIKILSCQFLLLILAATLAIFGGRNMLEVSPEQNRSFYDNTHPATINFDKMSLINKEIDALEVGDPSTIDNIGQSNRLLQQNQAINHRTSELCTFSITYAIKAEVTRFQPDRTITGLADLQRIRKIEQDVKDRYPQWCLLDKSTATCSSRALQSPVDVIGDLSSQQEVDERVKAILADEQAQGRDLFPLDNDLRFLRTKVVLGGPLNPADFGLTDQEPWTSVTKSKERSQQLELVKAFVKELYEHVSKITDVDFEVRIDSDLLRDGLYSELMMLDIQYGVYSTIFAYFFFWLYFRSLFLATIVILMIILQLPLTALITEGALGVTYFGQMELLIYYIVLSNSSAGTFMVIGTWNASEHLCDNSKKNNYQGHNLEKRVAYTYRKAWRGLGITSSTTAVAFMANYFSPLMPIKAFGIFSGVAVLSNYVLICTMFPVAIVADEVHQISNMCSTKKKQTKSAFMMNKAVKRINLMRILPAPGLKKLATAQSDAELKEGGDNESQDEVSYFSASDIEAEGGFFGKMGKKEPNVAEKDEAGEQGQLSEGTIVAKLSILFGENFNQMIFNARWSIVILFTVWLTYAFMQQIQLQFLTRPEELIPVTQARVIGGTIVKRHFAPQTDKANVQVQVHFGIASKLIKTLEDDSSVYGTPISVWNDTMVGRIERDRSFSLTIHRPEAQTYLVDMCERLSDKSFVVEGTLKCWPLAFKKWLVSKEIQWPITTQSEFYAQLTLWLSTVEGAQARKQRQLFVDSKGVIRFMWVGAEATVKQDTIATRKEPIFNQWESFIKAESVKAPAELRQMFQASETWPWMTMERAFEKSTSQGIWISLVFSFLILLVATRNFLISLTSIFVMWGVLASNQSFIALNGWKIGVSESISIVVQIGLSIDYIVHLAGEYSHSRMQTRFEKMKKSYEVVGASMLSCCITAVLSMTFLLGTQLIINVKFAAIIIFANSVAFIFTIVLFGAVLHIIGPQDGLGDLAQFYDVWSQRILRGQKKDRELLYEQLNKV